MRDVIYLLVLVGFFAAASGLVGLCERVIGHDEPTATPSTAADTSAAIPAESVTR